MQFFGIGILELLVILTLAILVIGPDRVPGFAADLARWIRQARAYANYLMKDFNQVVGELQKEAGVTKEDWKEIESVINRHTGDVVREMRRAADTMESTGEPEASRNGAGGVMPAESNAGQAVEPPPIPRPDRVSEPLAQANGASGEPETTPQAESQPAEDPDKPWYEPQRRTRRRASE